MVSTVEVVSVPRRDSVAARIDDDFGSLVTVPPHQRRFAPTRPRYEPRCPGIRSSGVRTALPIPCGEGDAGRIHCDDGPRVGIARFVDLVSQHRRTPSLTGTEP